ncbi:glycerophosphoinositol inositolphosphodiesterase GDPD2 isoform X1 [Latimeria chalumnae]|uniref:glycerophosphoinositol inositolphosphodiesterase GDPD2 isoform X1 n=1 Tax=Latimeria chalumnae TaxID=7897 RepID=UPI0003C180C2|nr:PREDICTED: glycerophosphoinositol inositolphosphodiesterase GDPD2 isoform X1 [Latimeria chalumnae]XP_005997213.1 PREDICTED: glycerophosphoinositol inositolphosphodiesterase GDPD2 isoform X1 [Latimeria chalumnae]XP_005997214.1 PREDICTED: glycerophosphoinositol inositolphosphodiesterase GDPD2 isoform X1 [Latimeria chalumnae]|eukprot:XP_005997212.1 PREDICTED: glycerophosphoinositol inositolphosphodiesterase GDPD2 isoform X1 [Latimeria chalumnae]
MNYPLCRPFCVSCFTCFYGCRRKCQNETTTKCECVWAVFLILIFALCVIWFYFYWAFQNDFEELNWFVFGMFKQWKDWSVPTLILAGVLLSYTFFLLILLLCHLAFQEPLRLHQIHKVLLIVTLFIIAIGILGINIKWKKEWGTIFLFLKVTAPAFHLGAVVVLTLLAWLVADRFFRARTKVLKVLVLGLYLCVMVGVYLIPLAIVCPCIMEEKDLGSKPNLTGHRGAPMLAPENTIMSFVQAMKCGVSVFETDVMVSKDGVPFLMHDETLHRTTDVKEMFGNRVSDHSSSFLWSELSDLNAGKWFLKTDPFGTVKSLSNDSNARAAQQKVVKLEELLNVARKENKKVLFDLRKPPACHPYSQTYVSVTVETILRTNISQDLILWLPNENRSEVMQMAPGFQQYYGEINDSRNESNMNFNLAYQNLSKIRDNHKNHTEVNLYVVNEPWLFSMLWCIGVNSVTTNACHIFSEMKKPIILISPDNYRMIWIGTDCTSLVIIILAFLLVRCYRRRQTLEIQTQREAHMMEQLRRSLLV